jgi:hypothetical protein
MKRAVLVLLLALVAWIGVSLWGPSSHSLRDFDGPEVGRLETDMWRSYYEHRPVSLFLELIETLRRQYHLPFWRSVAGAYHAAHAAEVFQKGQNRADYERALPDLRRYYRLIQRDSDVSFDPGKVAGLELEWWIIHRERGQHSEGDLENALAVLQAAIYSGPPSDFEAHAKTRAEAMLIRDNRADAGGVTEQDWNRIGALLDTSWTSASKAVKP